MRTARSASSSTGTTARAAVLYSRSDLAPLGGGLIVFRSLTHARRRAKEGARVNEDAPATHRQQQLTNTKRTYEARPRSAPTAPVAASAAPSATPSAARAPSAA